MGDDPPSASELKELADDVLYEVRMLQWAVRGLAVGVEHPWLRNALVEVARLHQRNLTCFFRGSGDGDDLIAAHFVEHWEPTATPERSRAHTALEGDLRPINKRLAHLTAYRQRVAKGQRELPLGEALRHVETLWSEFLGELGPERQGWFG